MFIFYKEKHSLKEHTHGEGTKCQNSTLPTLDKLILFRDIKWGNLFYPTLSFPNFFDMQYLNQFKSYYNFLFASNFDTLILYLIFDKKNEHMTTRWKQVNSQWCPFMWLLNPKYIWNNLERIIKFFL